jgi:hypothetical protein
MKAPAGRKARAAGGQATIEFALLYAGAILPLTFMTIFVAQMLWVWHGVADFTRDGARYAATHCFSEDGSNVRNYMRSHVPAIVDQAQFQAGDVEIQIDYLSVASDGSTAPFTQGCGGCIPDAVSVSVVNYRFLKFSSFLGLPPVSMPPFTTNLPMESAGLQDATGGCVP